MPNNANLDELSRTCRKDIIEMIHSAKSGHPGGSLSCIDILIALYAGGVMNHEKNANSWEGHDHFFMCKGHAAPALYSILARCGYFDLSELNTLRKLGSMLQGHPDCKKTPGVEVSTGSLGQGLSIACGAAYGLKLNNDDSTIFALLGDGECQEGQVWEAAMFGSHYKLDNLIAIIDHNNLQIDGQVSFVMNIEDISEKFRAFGWNVAACNGNDIKSVINTLNNVKLEKNGAPTCVIANTIKGCGVSFMENKAGWHGKAPSDEEYKLAIEELNNK